MAYSGRLYKTEGIILKRKNLGESDRLITILTREHGKRTVLGKGIRKIPSRRAGHLEVFTHAEFTLYKGKTFDYVSEVSQKTVFPEFSNDLKKVSFCYYLCELTDRLIPEHEEGIEVFDQLLESIASIAHSIDESARHTQVYTFAMELLWHLGFLPRSKHIPSSEMYAYVETIIERKLKTTKLLELTF